MDPNGAIVGPDVFSVDLATNDLVTKPAWRSPTVPKPTPTGQAAVQGVADQGTSVLTADWLRTWFWWRPT